MFSQDPSQFVGKRILATIIDYSFISGLTIFYISIAGHETDEAKYTVSGVLALVPVLFWFLYFVVCEKMLDGTIGYHIFKLKVVTEKGGKPTFSQTLTRRICDTIEITTCLGLIAYFIITRTDLSQRLGDILAKTTVVGVDSVYIDKNKA